MQQFIHALKQKPDHVRRRIAVGASAGITALVAVIWVTALSASGTFALESGTGNAKPPSTDAFALDGTNVKSNFSQLAGAVNAVTGATSSQASLTIIDGTTTSSIGGQTRSPDQNNTSATVIPF